MRTGITSRQFATAIQTRKSHSPVRQPRRARALPSLSLAALLVLSACVQPPPSGEVTRAGRYAPPGAAPDTCWTKHISPAVIETVTSQVLAEPAQLDSGGNQLRPATFHTETRQQIVKPRQENWIEIPCPQMMTPSFIGVIQRALKARNLYHGPVNGRMDRATRMAVQRYQAPQGLDSGTLSLASARKLGLVAVPG